MYHFHPLFTLLTRLPVCVPNEANVDFLFDLALPIPFTLNTQFPSIIFDRYECPCLLLIICKIKLIKNAFFSEFDIYLSTVALFIVYL